MNQQMLSMLLYFYGAFLITCGTTSVIFIGMKAKTALASGGISGLISIGIGYLISTNTKFTVAGGLFLSVALFIVFSWRSSKTLSKILELVPSSSNNDELKGKSYAFLIISLMAVVSMFVFIILLINY